MDKQSTIGFVLIAVVLMVWMWFNTPPPQPPQQFPDTTQVAARQAAGDTQKTATPADAALPQPRATAPATSESKFGEYFAARSTGTEKVLIVKTDLYTAEVTTNGGLLKKWELQNYKTWNQYPVQLVDLEKKGDLSLLFLSKDGRQINTRNLYFDADYAPWKTVTLSGEDSFSVDLVLPLGQGKRIVKRLTFTNGTYTLGAEVLFENVRDIVSGFEYQLLWENHIPYAEQNSIDESNYAMAYAYSGGELAEIDATTQSERVDKDINGATDWVAARNKYFAVAILPEGSPSQGAYLEGTRKGQPDRGEKEMYSIALKMPYKALASERSRFTVFLGPLDFSLISSMDRGLDHIMSLGFAWVIRPITEYIMLPLFDFLHLFIANWGIVIIVFSIIIKVALHPLTKSSMNSMRKMQKLQPLMTELREKYANDAQKMNQEMMKLYRDYGINPAGGCLPLLLQLPILYALYNVFASTIQLRQADFFGWIHDLSIPDAIVHLPFTLPLFGTNQLSGLALAMCITMFIQQKMTVTDPRQKAMVYLMPLMMLFIFNSLPSGLNLYYFVFNLLSIGQQYYVNKKHGDEPLRKVDPKKGQGGLIGKLAKNMPELNKR